MGVGGLVIEESAIDNMYLWYVFLNDVDSLVEVLHLFYPIKLSVFIYIACNHDHHVPSHLMHQLHTYTNASYRIAGGSASSSTRGAGRGRPTGNPGTRGARGRGARRGPARVRGPST
jgi:hypothetical protein